MNRMMKVQDPPKAATLSATRWPKVRLSSSSSFRLRETRERNNSSVLRRLRPMMVSKSSATEGGAGRTPADGLDAKTRVWESSTATAEAKRAPPSNSEISPNSSPGSMAASTIFSPSVFST